MRNKSLSTFFFNPLQLSNFQASRTRPILWEAKEEEEVFHTSSIAESINEESAAKQVLRVCSELGIETKMEGWDPTTKSTLTQIPLLTTKAGPRDGAAWTQRLKEEYKALIAYTTMNKSKDNDWFRISAANPEGTRWTGKCWYIHNLLKYEFDLQFDIPVTYPATAPEIELPQLDGKTHKMYRGGKICLTVHFKPLWAKNCPRFGIAHALCLGLAPWLAAEIPILVDSGMIKHKDDTASSSVVQ